MKTNCILLVLTAALLYWLLCVPRAHAMAESVPFADLVNLTNQVRIEAGVPELSVSPTLQRAAQLKANDMVKKGYFAHTSPEGKTPWFWFDKVGYDYSTAGENLAVGFSTSENVMKAWMKSTKHAANILDANYTQIGIATAKGKRNGKDAIYIVQFFGSL